MSHKAKTISRILGALADASKNDRREYILYDTSDLTRAVRKSLAFKGNYVCIPTSDYSQSLIVKSDYSGRRRHKRGR